MTAQSKTTIKSYFETGDKPTQAQFIDFIDSYQNVNSTLTTLASASVTTVGLQVLAATTSAAVLSLISGAPLASPTFTGVPAAPTASAGTSTTQLATTAFVASAIPNLTPIRNVLGSDVNLTDVGLYFDGPSVAQGSTGSWFASGTVTIIDGTGGGYSANVKLWDGTTVIASTQVNTAATSIRSVVTLSGYLATPAGNLRISVQDLTSTGGKIVFNDSGNSKDSNITAYRIA